MTAPDNRPDRCVAIAATARKMKVEPLVLAELSGLEPAVVVSILREPPGNKLPAAKDISAVERVIERMTLSISVAQRVRNLKLATKQLEELADIAAPTAQRLMREPPWSPLLSFETLLDIRRAIETEERRRNQEPRDVAVSIDARGVDHDVDSVRLKLGRLIGTHTMWVVSTRYDGYLQASHLVVEEHGARFLVHIYVPDDDNVGGEPPGRELQECYQFSGVVAVIGSAWYFFVEKPRPPYDFTCFVAPLGDHNRLQWLGHLVNPIHSKNRTQGEAFCTTPTKPGIRTWEQARKDGFFGYYKIEAYRNIFNEIMRA